MSSSESDVPANWTEGEPDTPKVIRVLNACTQLGIDASVHLKAWESIREAMWGDDNPVASLATWHFVVSGTAHIQLAVLHAAKLFEKRKDSISIGWLVSLLRAASDGDFEDRRAAVLKCASRLEGTMEEHRETIEEIKSRRDRRIAHLDRDALSASFDQESAIDASNLKMLVKAARASLSATRDAFPEFDVPADAYPAAKRVIGAEDLSDLLYFAREAYWSDTTGDPNQFVAEHRRFAKHMREARRTARTKNLESDDRKPPA